MSAVTVAQNATYQNLVEGLKGQNIEILTSGLEGYEESIKRWSEAAEKRAAAVVFPETATHVSEVVKVARAHNIEFVVSCGRHSTGGASSIEDGVVIDLQKMNKVKVDEQDKTVTFGGGSLWADVDIEAGKYGLATVGGTVNHTGVGGLILGGGFGWLSGRYGLTIDNLLSAEVVLADGRILTASPTSNPDVFWAIRGAGSSFAIATSFTMQAYAQPDPVWAGTLVFTPDKLDQLVAYANKFHETATDEAFIFGFMCAPPTFQPMLMAVVFFNGSEEDGRSFFADLLSIGPVADMTQSMPYSEVNAMFNPVATFGDRKSNGASAMTYPLQPAMFHEVWEKYVGFIESHRDAGIEGSITLFTMIPYSKILSVPLESTAFASRGVYYNAEMILRWRDPTLDLTARKFNREVNARIREIGGSTKDRGVGNYANNIDYQVDPKRVFGVNTERLRQLKQVYDPTNCFRKWHDVLYQEKTA